MSNSLHHMTLRNERFSTVLFSGHGTSFCFDRQFLAFFPAEACAAMPWPWCSVPGLMLSMNIGFALQVQSCVIYVLYATVRLYQIHTTADHFQVPFFQHSRSG